MKTERPPLDEKDLDIALAALKSRILDNMARYGSQPYSSPAEALGAILLETQEFHAEVQKRNLHGQKTEALDIAAASLFYVMEFARSAGELRNNEKYKVVNFLLDHGIRSK